MDVISEVRESHIMPFFAQRADTFLSVATSTPVLSTVEAEIHFRFELSQPVSRPELRGRLMGPRCSQFTTVEVAYPLRPLPGNRLPHETTVIGRVVIPEPSLWDPTTPCLYEGPIELWNEGEPLVRLQVSHGLRNLALTVGGLRWNNKPIVLRGLRVDAASEADTLAWRRDGFNAWLIHGDEEADTLCALADRYGFLVVVVVDGHTGGNLLADLSEYASCAGWIVPGAWLQQGSAAREIVDAMKWRKQLLGICVDDPSEIERAFAGAWPAEVSFVYGDERILSANVPGGVLRLIRQNSQLPNEPAVPGMLGHIVD